MKFTIKKAATCLLALLLAFCAAPVTRAESPPASGQCGDAVFWEFDAETRTLTIFGEGEM